MAGDCASGRVRVNRDYEVRRRGRPPGAFDSVGGGAMRMSVYSGLAGSIALGLYLIRSRRNRCAFGDVGLFNTSE